MSFKIFNKPQNPNDAITPLENLAKAGVIAIVGGISLALISKAAFAALGITGAAVAAPVAVSVTLAAFGTAAVAISLGLFISFIKDFRLNF